MKNIFRTISVLIIFLGLTRCGIKGPLYSLLDSTPIREISDLLKVHF